MGGVLKLMREEPLAAEPGMEFCLLGPLLVRRGRVEVPVPPGKQRSLLAALLLNANALVPVGQLAEALWGADLPRSAESSLENMVSRLRRSLGDVPPSRILAQAGSYRIRVEPGELDVDRFEALVAMVRAAARSGAHAAAAERAREALSLWRGQPLAGVPSEVLALREVPRLEEMRLQALEARIESDLRADRHGEVIIELRQLAAAHPLRERLPALLMLALDASGQRAEALAVYQSTRSLLAAELGIEPGPELRDIQRQILAGEPAGGLRSEVARGPAGADGAGPAEAGVRSWLPPDTAAFTGREPELEMIGATVAGAAGAGGVVGIHAIGGMPGVGKTALAVHAAHRLQALFPGLQLFIDLHGHTPGRDPVPPEAALARLLAAMGIDARSLPAGLAGRAALWRQTMAGQRALLVLDNAASSAQVTPLLPGGDGCLVLVTSRRHLGDLPGPVTVIPVDVLAPGQARQMFTRLAPRAMQAPPVAMDEVVRLAGGLPLAVSLLARVYARHPSWTLADLAAETQAGVLTLAAENDSVAAAFEVSYRYLAPARQRFFRRLGLHPGTTIDAHAAAALAGMPLAGAAGLLDALHGEGLLTEVSYRRYGMHDLIRRYARDRAAADPAADRDRAVGRLLDYYQHVAATAEALLARQPRTSPAATTVMLAAVPDLADRGRALAWVRAERGNLIACLDHATRAGQDARVVALTGGLAGLLRQDGPWADAITRHEAAVRAARRLGDQPGEAGARTDLGDVRRLTGDYPGAARALEAALAIYRDLGDRQGEGNARTALGDVRRLTGDYPGAASALEAALAIYRDLGHRQGEGNVLRELGVVQLMTGDYPGAAGALEAALGIYRGLGHRQGQVDALTELGVARRLTGDYPGAASALEAALGICRDLGHRLGQAGALTELGAVRQLTGDYPGAASALDEALSIFRDLGHRRGQASALTESGIVQRLTGDYPGAASALDEALGIFRDLGERGGEAQALNEAGTLHRVRGALDQATACHRQALHLARQIGSSLDEASALAGLGRCALAAGHAASGQASLRQAQEIFRAIGAAEASDVTTELTTLTTAGPAAGPR